MKYNFHEKIELYNFETMIRNISNSLEVFRIRTIILPFTIT